MGQGGRGRRSRRRRTGMQQMRVYVLGSLDLILAFVPVSAVLLLYPLGLSTAWTLPWLVALTALCVASALAIHHLSAREMDDTPVPRWCLPLLGVTTVCASALACVVLPDPYALSSGSLPAATYPLLATLVVAVLGLTPRLRAPWILGASVLIALVVVAVASAAAATARPEWWRDDALVLAAAVFAPTLVIAAGVLLSTRWSLTVLYAMRDQETMDALRADLAVADERLRIARDLHDVFGRALTAVAVKSDLSAALAEGGRMAQASEESRAVRALAEDALREVRGVLAGYRTPDLAAEVAGARSLLGSAGVRTRVIGDPHEVPTWAVEPLAWVVREAATNIVRHSDATACTLSFDASDSGVRLTVVNDGVPVPRSGDTPAGSGLAGLDARLRRRGGALSASASGDTFTVDAHVTPPPAQGAALVNDAHPGAAPAPHRAHADAPDTAGTAGPGERSRP